MAGSPGRMNDLLSPFVLPPEAPLPSSRQHIRNSLLINQLATEGCELRPFETSFQWIDIIARYYDVQGTRKSYLDRKSDRQIKMDR